VLVFRVKRTVVAIAAAAVLPLSAAAAPATEPRLEQPNPADIVKAARITDATLATAPRLLAAPAWWGGRYTTPSGETVAVQISDRYPQDQGLAERWAAFIGSLVHGEELSRLTAYIAPLREVQSLCGIEALACYIPQDQALVAPGEDIPGQASAEALVVHEYGHHVAANRENPPWRTVDYGTKRWASYQQICRDARAGRVFPGEEDDPRRYALNPGEGFAEAYRVLNQRRLALAESAWDLVSNAFYPDGTALTMIERDVLRPWTRNSTSTVRGSFTLRGKARTHAVPTALDGRFELTLRAPSSMRLRVELLTATGTRVGQATVRGGSRALRTTVCGARAHSLRVTRLDGRGSYRLSVSKP